MNIQEVEALTGLTRGNIRFYEKEGFFAVERQPNGYRNYTEENVKTLKRIRLLRKLRVPLEEIRRLQADETTLHTVLSQAIREAEAEKKELAKGQEICRKIISAGATYDTLQPDAYLRQFGEPLEEDKSSPLLWDQEFEKPHTWRRFFSHQFDLLVYMFLAHAAYFLLDSSANVWVGDYYLLIIVIASAILLLLLEPVFLHFFGMTPGKWMLGMKIFHLDGRYLTMEEARSRTTHKFFGGWENLHLGRYRMWKFYYDSENGESLPWEIENIQQYRELTPRRIWAVGGAVAAMAAVSVFLWSAAKYPPNRGLLTKAELAENINAYLNEFAMDSGWRLDSDCNWQELPNLSGEYTIYISGAPRRPQLQITERDGYVTGISFVTETSADGLVGGSTDYVELLMYAFGGAQRGAGPFGNGLNRMLALIDDYPLESYTEVISGVEFTYSIEYEGYDKAEIFLFGREDTNRWLQVEFSMELSR